MKLDESVTSSRSLSLSVVSTPTLGCACKRAFELGEDADRLVVLVQGQTHVQRQPEDRLSEALIGSQLPQLFKRTARDLFPPPGRHCCSFNQGSSSPDAREEDERHLPGVRFPKLGCLWGTWVDCGDLGIWLYLAKAVGVADGQVVEATVDGRILGDGKGGLVVFKIECLPMNEADAEPIVSRLSLREARREPRLARTRAARRRVHDGSRAQLEREVVAVDDMDVPREATAEWRRRGRRLKPGVRGS